MRISYREFIGIWYKTEKGKKENGKWKKEDRKRKRE